jgi:hypothetical protein
MASDPTYKALVNAHNNPRYASIKEAVYDGLLLEVNAKSSLTNLDMA